MEVKLERTNQELQEAMQTIRDQDQKLTDSVSKVCRIVTDQVLLLSL